jgi:hypothetical protein
MPWLFGPNSRMPWEWASSTISRSRWMPSSPTSLKPAVWTMANFTPFWPHSSMTRGTSVFLTEMFTRSISPGTSSTDL